MSGDSEGDDRLRDASARFEIHAAAPNATLGGALCATAVDVLRLAGAGISIHSPAGTPYSIGIAGAAMAEIHELERELGEGPCIDAFSTVAVSAEPDLAHPVNSRWPLFRIEALRTPARAVFGYPLHTGGTCLGALNLYHTRPGDLSRQQHEDAILLAQISTRSILASYTGDSPGLLADSFDDDQMQLHQATGMVSVQLQLSPPDALARIKGHAFAAGRPLRDVAADIVERRLRFDE